MECVELALKEEESPAPVTVKPEEEEKKAQPTLQLSGVDNRLRIASKDIRNSEINQEDDEEELKEVRVSFSIYCFYFKARFTDIS